MLDDLKKSASSTELFSLEAIIAPRLFTLTYLLGLATIVLLAMDHLFFSFRFGFGNGIWGLLEIAVIAPLAVLALRIVSEAGILFFKNNRKTSDNINQEDHLEAASSLIEDVAEAIDELAVEETGATVVPKENSPGKRTGTTTKPRARKTPLARKAPLAHKVPGRTAKRKPSSTPKS